MLKDPVKINKELDSYCLGLFCADGNLYQREISLTSKDIELCEIMQKVLNRRIETRSDGLYRIRLKSRYFSDLMRNYGMRENKSYTLGLNELFIKLNDKMKKHFIRGFLDGDGSINISKARYSITFYNTDRKLLESIAQNLNPSKFYLIQKKDKKTDLFQLTITRKENFFKIYHYLYNYSKYFLLRKKAYFLKMLQYEFKHGLINKKKTEEHRKNLSISRTGKKRTAPKT